MPVVLSGHNHFDSDWSSYQESEEAAQQSHLYFPTEPDLTPHFLWTWQLREFHGGVGEHRFSLIETDAGTKIRPETSHLETEVTSL